MTTITKKNARKLPDPPFGNVPYGNKTMKQYTFITNASGVLVDSDVSAAVGNGDKVILGIIPGGMLLADCLSNVSDAFTAATTAKIGFEYVDGVDDSDVPQDDDYFHAALDTAALGRTPAENTAVVPVTLAKDAYLILTVGGAAHAAAGRLDILVDGVLTGQK